PSLALGGGRGGGCARPRWKPPDRGAEIRRARSRQPSLSGRRPSALGLKRVASCAHHRHRKRRPSSPCRDLLPVNGEKGGWPQRLLFLSCPFRGRRCPKGG